MIGAHSGGSLVFVLPDRDVPLCCLPPVLRVAEGEGVGGGTLPLVAPVVAPAAGLLGVEVLVWPG
jgi:hypothetical protein